MIKYHQNHSISTCTRVLLLYCVECTIDNTVVVHTQYSTVQYSTVQCSAVQYSTVQYSVHCTVLYCTILYCTVPHHTTLYHTVPYCTVLYCTVLVILFSAYSATAMSRKYRQGEPTPSQVKGSCYQEEISW